METTMEAKERWIQAMREAICAEQAGHRCASLSDAYDVLRELLAEREKPRTVDRGKPTPLSLSDDGEAVPAQLGFGNPMCPTCNGNGRMRTPAGWKACECVKMPARCDAQTVQWTPTDWDKCRVAMPERLYLPVHSMSETPERWPVTVARDVGFTALLYETVYEHRWQNTAREKYWHYPEAVSCADLADAGLRGRLEALAAEWDKATFTHRDRHIVELRYAIDGK